MALEENWDRDSTTYPESFIPLPSSPEDLPEDVPYFVDPAEEGGAPMLDIQEEDINAF